MSGSERKKVFRNLMRPQKHSAIIPLKTDLVEITFIEFSVTAKVIYGSAHWADIFLFTMEKVLRNTMSRVELCIVLFFASMKTKITTSGSALMAADCTN